MRVWRGWGLLVTCLALSLVAQPATAIGEHQPVTHAGDLAGFALRGSDGYEIEVLTLGRHLVILNASKGHVSATYSTRGRISGNRIRARFGNLGRISLTFHAAGAHGGAATRAGGCADPTAVREAGTFRGLIRFRGERGYTKVDADRAAGIVVRAERSACSRKRRAAPSAASPLGRLSTHLLAVSKHSGRVVTIDVLGFGDPHLWVQASTEEHRGKMNIVRLAYAIVGGQQAFLTSEADAHPAFAVLRPPKPFSGTGTFQEDADLAPNWTGDLAAWLPGAGKVSLAGQSFASSFCKQPRGGPGCSLFPPIQRRLRIVQDSGSQSQAFRDVRLSWSR